MRQSLKIDDECGAARSGLPFGTRVMSVVEERVDLAPVVRTLREGGDETIIARAHEVAARIAPRAARYDREGVYPAESIEDIWSAGLAALTIPAEFGGVDASVSTTARAVEILSVADSATALVLVWGFGQHRFINAPGSKWPEHWRRRIAQDALEAPALINALRVEPLLGTPARGGVPATTAARITAPDGSPAWRVNGHKIYCTGSYGLRWLPVWVATEPDDPEGLQVGTIVIPADAPGVEIVETWDHLGMRASVGHDMIFTDVVVPIDNAIDLQPFTGTDPAMRTTRGPARRADDGEPVVAGRLHGRRKGGAQLARRVPQRPRPEQSRQAVVLTAPVPARRG